MTESAAPKIPNTDISYDPGSFRDRHGRVFYRNGDVLRAINEEALSVWESLSTSRFFPAAIQGGRIIATEKIPATPPDGWAATLKHERLPFISYPYEWTFSMLKDAALLQLELLQAALQEGFILKDSSAFNFQWKGARPILIDLLSFKKLMPGEPWIGYRQFCQMFLYPLMLQAYKGLDFQPLMRGSIEGITPAQMNGILSLRDRFRRGVMSHVYLQNKLQSRLSDTRSDVRSEMANAGFSREMIQLNVRNLEKLIRNLEWVSHSSDWSGYTRNTSYTSVDAAEKEDFVKQVVESRTWRLVWDLGSNTGEFARIAARRADLVLAIDADHLVVERMYRSLKRDECTNILPLVMNLSDASPAFGWRGLERKSLEQRTRPDLIFCLALLHHMVIAANIPMQEFIHWLADFRSDLIIEFIEKEDPMTRKLLRSKDDQYLDYSMEFFEKCLSERCRIVNRKPLPSRLRILYHARPL